MTVSLPHCEDNLLKYSETWCHGHLAYLITAVIRSPRFYGHFFWPPERQNGHTFSCKKKTLVNTVTPEYGQIFFGPLVSVLTGFHCIINVSSRVFKGIDQIQVNHRILSVAHQRLQPPTPNPQPHHYIKTIR